MIAPFMGSHSTGVTPWETGDAMPLVTSPPVGPVSVRVTVLPANLLSEAMPVPRRIAVSPAAPENLQDRVEFTMISADPPVGNSGAVAQSCACANAYAEAS